MKHEIAFLMELFLEEDPKKFKTMIKNRMDAVTNHLTKPTVVVPPLAPQLAPQYEPDAERVIRAQSPSMQRIMANNPDLIPKVAPPVTPAAAAALAAREALIMGAGKDKPEKGRTGPRKM